MPKDMGPFFLSRLPSDFPANAVHQCCIQVVLMLYYAKHTHKFGAVSRYLATTDT